MRRALTILLIFLGGNLWAQAPAYSYKSQQPLIPAPAGAVYLGMTKKELAAIHPLDKLTFRNNGSYYSELVQEVDGESNPDKIASITYTLSTPGSAFTKDMLQDESVVMQMELGFPETEDAEKYFKKTFTKTLKGFKKEGPAYTFTTADELQWVARQEGASVTVLGKVKNGSYDAMLERLID